MAQRRRPSGGCRILSNARCLSEGIDVPALDAVLFMSRAVQSIVDIVQAVGRAMRKADGKDVRLHRAAGRSSCRASTPPLALDDNEPGIRRRSGAVLRALRSHDDRL